jgi:GAF domain-containing protein
VDLELLPSIILAIAEQRSLNGVLDTIIRAVARQPDVALARLWLLENDGECPHCHDASPTASTALHLRASAGAPRSAGTDWSRTNGRFHRVPLESGLKLAYIARTGLPIRIPDLAADREWIREPQWAEQEGLVSFAARPLVSRGETLGVLGVFRRVPADDRCWE